MIPPRQPGSLGLGLFIARAIVNAHAGTLTVTSTADAGTTFIAFLPRHPASGTPVSGNPR